MAASQRSEVVDRPFASRGSVGAVHESTRAGSRSRGCQAPHMHDQDVDDIGESGPWPRSGRDRGREIVAFDQEVVGVRKPSCILYPGSHSAHGRNWRFLLRDIEGLAWLDVARIMDKNTESAVRELHRRATQEMKRQLAKRGFVEVGS